MVMGMGRRRLSIAYIATVAMAMAALLQSSSAQTVHVVGDALGWVIPPGGATVYSSWATNNTFRVGDTLVFNFQSGVHDVAKVSKLDYDACNNNSPLVLLSNPPANVTLNETGAHYFLCAFPGHCTAGQQLAINVTAATASSPAPQPSTPAPQPSSPAPQPVSTPPPASSPQPSAPAPAPQAGSPTPISAPTPSPSPSRSPMTYTVGDNLGWTIPQGGASAYETWATGKSFMVGDTLVFNYVTGAHDVAEVTKEAYQPCTTTNLLSNFTTAPTRITLTTAGEHFYICAFQGHCAAGQKLAINVTGSSSSSPSPSPSPTTAATPPSSNTTPSTPSPAGDNNGTTPPATPGGSATSLGVASLSSSIFLALIVVAFLM